MEELRFTCCFTGHRKIPREHMAELHAELERVLNILIRSGVDTFRTGGAMGFDTLAALTVLDKKELHPHIRLELCLPCKDQTNGWSRENKDIYEYILSRADKVTFLHESYTPYCMHERNRFMVDGSDYCVGYCTESSGGSRKTLDYAKRKNVKVINIAEIFKV